MDKVILVKPLPHGRLMVEMAGGRCGEFDVNPYMRSSYFQELSNSAYFNQVRTVFGGVGWPNGQDLGPDTIAAELVEVERST